MTKVELKEMGLPHEQRNIRLHTGLDEKAREKVVAQLKVILADSYLLMLKTHYYHWNVKGPLFKSLHDLTEEQYNEIFEAIDVIAERIRALGHEAPGTFSQYMKLSHVSEASSGQSGLEMTADLLKSQEALIKNCRKCHGIAADATDEVTVDLMVARLSTHEKNAWMLRSLLES